MEYPALRSTKKNEANNQQISKQSFILRNVDAAQSGPNIQLYQITVIRGAIRGGSF